MPRKLPRDPKNTWKGVLVAIYDEFGYNEFTSRDVADILKITGPDASMRMRRFRNHEVIKHVETSRHNKKVYRLTKYGLGIAKDLKKKGE